MKIYDVTVSISKDMVVYPGDPPVKIERKSTINKNDAKSNLSRYSFGSHTGTHVESSLHFLADGLSIDLLPLDQFVGEADVVEVDGAAVTAAALESAGVPADCQRLLIKTANSERWA